MNPKHSPTCTTCGYDLEGLGPEASCPECGAANAGIIVERPHNIRRWLAEACRFAANPLRALHRPIVHGRADKWISYANLVVGSGLICTASSLPLVAESIYQARRYSLGLGTTNEAAGMIAVAIGTMCGGGLFIGTLLAIVHRAVVALSSTQRLRDSRARTRAVLAASSYPVLLVGVASSLLIALPIFVTSLFRNNPTVVSSGPSLWGVAISGASLLAAAASLLVATVLSCLAAAAPASQPSVEGSASDTHQEPTTHELR